MYQMKFDTRIRSNRTTGLIEYRFTYKVQEVIRTNNFEYCIDYFQK